MHTYIHIYTCTDMYICTYIHAYIPWNHKCVTKTVRCGKSHKYANILNFYSVKYYKRITYQ